MQLIIITIEESLKSIRSQYLLSLFSLDNLLSNARRYRSVELMRKVLIPLDGENAGLLRIESFHALSVEMVRKVLFSSRDKYDAT